MFVFSIVIIVGMMFYVLEIFYELNKVIWCVEVIFFVNSNLKIYECGVVKRCMKLGGIKLFIYFIGIE